MLREMREEDAEAIHVIFTDALGYTTSQEVISDRIAELASDDRTLSLVWTEGAEEPPLGFVHAMSYETLHTTGGWDIISLAVMPARQGEGIGHALLAETERILKARGASFIRLNSRMDRDGAHAFYEIWATFATRRRSVSLSVVSDASGACACEWRRGQ